MEIAATFRRFRAIWAVRAEAFAPPGERPVPLSLAACELRTGRRVELAPEEARRDGLRAIDYADAEALVVGSDVVRELGCLLALGGPRPCHVLDLRLEALGHPGGAGPRPGLHTAGPKGFGLDALELACLMRGDASGGERGVRRRLRQALDVIARLFRGLESGWADPGELGRALLRGRYLASVAVVEAAGIPADPYRLEGLIATAIGVKPGPGLAATDGQSRPQPSGTRGGTRGGGPGPPVGGDGRNRTPLRPFGTITGRNNPDPARYLPLAPRRLRSAIRPAPGRVLATLDWHAQEVGMAGTLSGDARLVDAYRSGDPYLAFGRAAGLLPASATGDSHSELRHSCKAALLGVLYGIGADALSRSTGLSCSAAARLLDEHRRLYRGFWSWCEANEARAALECRLESSFGWGLAINPATRPGTIRNFPIQADGAEMLRLAACLAVDRGLEVCGLAHDALLIEGTEDSIAADIEAARRAMDEASAVVLDGPALRVDVRVLCREGTT